MGFFTSILGKSSAPEKKRQLPPLPKTTLAPLPRVNKVDGTSQKMRSNFDQLLKEQKNPEIRPYDRSTISTALDIQRGVLAIPEVDMNSGEMLIYSDWVIEQASTAVDVLVPKNAPYAVNIHLKKGGIYYIEPLGIYYFSADHFRLKADKKFPQGPGFMVDASHCLNSAEVANFIQRNVMLNNGSDFYIPGSTDEIHRHKRGL